MTLFENIKVLTKAEDDLINVYIDKTKKEVLSYIGKEEYLSKYDNVVEDIVIIKINRHGTEGLASQGYSGVSESYLNDYPESIIKQLNSFKAKVMFI